MVDLVILGNNLNLFDADAFLDSDGDLRLRLTYLDEDKNHKTITTGKILVNDIAFDAHFYGEERIDINLSIIPDKLKNLLTMETYE